MLDIIPVAAFSDNYIWLIRDTVTNQTLIVDPGTADPVIEAMNLIGTTPVGILITHHHPDHINGVRKLSETFHLPVFGPKIHPNDVITVDITGQNYLADNDHFPTISVLSTPGHSPSHVSYLIENKLFCGDTLFSGGCGRLLDEKARPVAISDRPSAAKQLYDSLIKISQLASDTQLYCAHEYTLSNLHFALTVEPDNTVLQQRLVEVNLLREQDQITLPSTLEIERLTNPFLRCEQPQVIEAAQKYVGSELHSAADVFSTLRAWKENF
jgi:hydroxyacylglutathione hydrolase